MGADGELRVGRRSNGVRMLCGLDRRDFNFFEICIADSLR
jgi:hypothetical protein